MAEYGMIRDSNDLMKYIDDRITRWHIIYARLCKKGSRALYLCCDGISSLFKGVDEGC
jgi:hypothetical protein